MTTLAGNTKPSLVRLSDVTTDRSNRRSECQGFIANCGPLIVVCLVALIFVVLMPIQAPWWHLIDSDGAYLGNALNLLLGNQTKLIEHPGVSLQQLLSGCLYVDYLVRGLGTDLTIQQYVDDTFADMNRALPILRVCGISFLIFGITATYEVVRRLWSNRRLAVMAALLFLAVPGHLSKSLHFRPENLLSGLCVIIVFLLIRGRQTHKPWYYVSAAAIFGLAVGVKIHAVAMFAIFPFAWFDRRTEDFFGQFIAECRSLWNRRKGTIVTVAAACWILIIVSNYNRAPAVVDWKLMAAVGALALYFIVGLILRTARTPYSLMSILVSPAAAVMLVAALFGFFGPHMAVADEIRPLFWQFAQTCVDGPARGTGDSLGMLGGLKAFASALASFGAWPLVLICFVASVMDLRIRAYKSLYWLIAAGGMGALALARGPIKPSVHYLAPTLTLLIPVVISSIASVRGEIAGGRHSKRHHLSTLSFCGWCGFTVIVAGPLWLTVVNKHDYEDHYRAIENLSKQYLSRLSSDQVLLMNYGAMDEEASFYMLVREYCHHAPRPQQHSYPDTPTAMADIDRLRLCPEFYLVGGSGMPTVQKNLNGSQILTSAWGRKWEVSRIEQQNGLTVYKILRPAQTASANKARAPSA